MTETSTYCVRGCAQRDYHLDECEGVTGTGKPCRGCLPRIAKRGLLCWPCHRRFELMLTDAPTAHRWLTGNLSGQGSPEGDKITGSREQPMPIKAAIFDTRQLLEDRLALWVDDWVEFKGLTGPDRHTVEGDAEYLLRWLPGIEALEWIGDWWEELAETMIDAHAVAPWRPVMRRVPTVPCPECAETNLAIFGGESDITCLSCRTIIREEHFQLWEQIVAEDTEDEAS